MQSPSRCGTAGAQEIEAGAVEFPYPFSTPPDLRAQWLARRFALSTTFAQEIGALAFNEGGVSS